MSLAQVVCAVDVGTSEIRAALVSETGERVHEVAYVRSAQQQLPAFDAEILWADAVRVLSSLVMGKANVSILNVSITCHVGQVVVDVQGKPLVEAGGWSDVRGLDILQSRIGNDLTILHRTGKPRLTGGWVPLLVWLRENHPELHKRVRWVMAPKDFINFRLTENIATDPTSAAYSFGYDVHKRAWDSGLISLSGLDPSCFPNLINSTDFVGLVTKRSSDLTGLPAGIPVVSGAPDGTLGSAALIGLAENVIADIAGTTDVLMRVTPDILNLNTLGVVVNPFILPGYWSYGGSTGLTGGATAYWSRLFGFENVSSAMDEYGTKIESLPVGCDGLFMSPLLSGSRFPTWNSKERGAVWGLEAKHEVPHFLKASYESASFVVRDAIEKFPLVNREKSKMYLAGGIVRSKPIVQMRADILGCSILASRESNLSLKGTALLGLTAAGINSNFEEARLALKSELETFIPDEANSEIYEGLYRKWVLLRQK